MDKIYDLLPLFLGWIDSFKPKEMSNASGVGSLPLNSLKSWPVETADPLVRNVLLNLAGYDLCYELYKAAFDMAFYTEDYENEQFAELANRLAPQYLVLDREKEDAFPMYFEEMMTGHWAAGYYSHTWSKMLAADLFSAYLEV